MSDLIDRQAAIDAVTEALRGLPVVCKDIAEEAIKQLPPANFSELPNNSDTISRKWLMECVDEGWIKFDTEKDKNIYVHLVRDIAPSAQPEPKRGKWIEAESQCGIKCSKCGYPVDDFCHSIDYIDLDYAPNFCPNCGSDNREVTT